MKTPILFLVFNRPEHTAAVLATIRAAQPQKLYIHADGARPDRPDEPQKVAAVRQICQQIDWECQVFTLFREKNYGMRDGVGGAISWFFDNESEGIILEDDSLADPTFFQFCEILLEKYRYDERILHIGGSNLLAHQTANAPQSYFFTGFSFVWGWASWRRAWQKMNLPLDGLEQPDVPQKLKKWLPNPLARAYLLDKFWVTRRRENKSWAYAWQYSILKINGLCIVPSKNLVRNTGIGDAEATNTSSNRQELNVRATSIEFPLRHPNVVEKKSSLDQEFFYVCQKSRWRLYLWFFLKKIGLR